MKGCPWGMKDFEGSPLGAGTSPGFFPRGGGANLRSREGQNCNYQCKYTYFNLIFTAWRGQILLPPGFPGRGGICTTLESRGGASVPLAPPPDVPVGKDQLQYPTPTECFDKNIVKLFITSQKLSNIFKIGLCHLIDFAKPYKMGIFFLKSIGRFKLFENLFFS